MIKFFEMLTRENWGAPWHVVLAIILTAPVWMGTAFLPITFGQRFAISGLIVTGILLLYEMYQKKKKRNSRRDFWQDMAANIGGMIIASLIILLITFRGV